MARNSRALEINVISAEGLCTNWSRQPVKKNTFVIVRGATVAHTDSDDVNYDYATNIDKEGGSYPVWNQKFLIEIPMHADYFTLDVQCKSFSGDRIIGFARVTVSDFTGAYFPRNYLHFLSYRLRDRKGERNGIINLSVMVRSTEEDSRSLCH